MAKEFNTKVTTGKVRFSYAHLFEPHAFDSNPDKKQYSMSVLIDKSDKETLRNVKRAIDEATKQGKASKWSGKVPTKFWNPLRDGDEERSDNEEYAGKMFINAKSNRKPGIFDRNLQAIIDPEEVYSGCYGRVSLNFFPFSHSGNAGIGVGLNGVQKLSDGEALGGGGSSKDDFDDDFEDGFDEDEDFLL